MGCRLCVNGNAVVDVAAVAAVDVQNFHYDEFVCDGLSSNLDHGIVVDVFVPVDRQTMAGKQLFVWLSGTVVLANWTIHRRSVRCR